MPWIFVYFLFCFDIFFDFYLLIFFSFLVCLFWIFERKRKRIWGWVDREAGRIWGGVGGEYDQIDVMTKINKLININFSKKTSVKTPGETERITKNEQFNQSFKDLILEPKLKWEPPPTVEAVDCGGNFVFWPPVLSTFEVLCTLRPSPGVERSGALFVCLGWQRHLLLELSRAVLLRLWPGRQEDPSSHHLAADQLLRWELASSLQYNFNKVSKLAYVSRGNLHCVSFKHPYLVLPHPVSAYYISKQSPTYFGVLFVIVKS